MCTVTLRRDESGLLLTMNRDELRARGEEIPPQVALAGSAQVPWLGPRDAARGGTWLGVNAYGVTACLMNGNVPLEESIRAIEAGAPSRGAIIPEVLAKGNAAEVLAWIREGFDPAPYPAFMLLVADETAGRLFTWWGKGTLGERVLETPWAMVSSSQWETEQVLAYRSRAFANWLESGAPFDGVLPSIHKHRIPGEEAFGIWVERGYACTRSITQVQVPWGDADIVMRYASVDERIDAFRESRLGKAAAGHSGSQ